METGIKSSFIPQDATVPQSVRPMQRTGLADLFVLISIVFLVASLALGAGIFLYERYLSTAGTSKLDQLDRAQQAFEPSLIQELTRLDDRMKAADSLLSTHIAPTIFFKMLEQLTLKTVAFSGLTFQGGNDQSMTIVMDGVAQSVNSIALQADYLSKSGVITNPIFSNIDRRADGVHFNLRAIVNPSSLRYLQLSSGVSTPPSPEEVIESDPSPFGAPPSGAAPGTPDRTQPQQ
jgi:hypothetical protein